MNICQTPPLILELVLSTLLIFGHKLRLNALNRVLRVEELRVPPNNRLEALKGDRKGQFSINDQWRICFRFENGQAFDVEIVDYH